MTPTIYLAGPVQHADDGGHGWRDQIKEDVLSVEWLDPLDKYDVPSGDIDVGTDISAEQIVESDKEMIDGADAVLARYAHMPSVGTPMEILYAYERDIPVFVWVDAEDTSGMSPWITHHAAGYGTSREQMAIHARAEAGKESPGGAQTAEEIAASVPEEAAEVLFERGSHGGAVENHEHIAALWSALLGHDITARQAALCMILVKMSRSEAGEAVRDHDVDICGYAGIARACSEVQGR